MATLLAGIGGALIGLMGVAIGAWLQSRREHQRWLRDQKLRAAIDFIGGTGDLYQRRRQLRSEGSSVIDGQAAWVRLQDGRSALHLLCEASTVDAAVATAAEAVVMRIGHIAAEADQDDEEATALLRNLVPRLRTELRAGIRKQAGQR
jgi:hypothetical protein